MLPVMQKQLPGDLFAFSPLAKIEVPLRQAAAGNAHPRCIYFFKSPHSQKEHHPLGGVLFGGVRGI